VNDGLVDDLAGRAIQAVVGLASEAGTIDAGPLRIKLVTAGGAAGATRYGIGVSLAAGGLEAAPVGELAFTIDGDGSWDLLPAPTGEHVELMAVQLATTGSTSTVAYVPSVRVRGLGVRVRSTDGPLFDLGVRLEEIAVHCAYLRDATGFVHGGVRVSAGGLALPIGGGGATPNPVATKLLSGDTSGGDTESVRPTFNPQLVVWKNGSAPTTVAVRADVGAGPWWLPIQRAFGPLYVEQVGLDVDGTAVAPQSVSILVDGGVSLAGFAIGVDDLSLTIPWATALNPGTWKLDLAGLAVAVDGSGFALAGGLRRLEREVGIEYAGMLVLHAADLGITAVGSYGEFPVPGTNQRYTSMFVFAALAAPLGGPPALFVMGIGAGIGLNRRLIVPADMTQVASFPLVAALDPASALVKNPMGALQTLGTTFPPQRGALWFAAGIRFTSFTVVESIAVLTVSIGDDLEVALLGLSRMSLPTPLRPLVQVELAIRARFSAREAVLSVQAQLTDNSWVVNPSCRLSGGFAFVIWFRTGEFVLTLGGYHPAYRKPAHFPHVPRLGITWAVSSAVAVKGQAYFALTPTCVMAGGRLEASYAAGIVRASFVAGIDAIVSWDPSFYDVTAFVAVSARVQIVIDLGWFGKARVTIGVSVGADIHVWGPRLRGEAALDLDVTSLVVRFGPTDPPTGKEPLGWSAFHDKYLVAGDPTGLTMNLGVLAGQMAPEPGAPTSDPDDGSPAKPFRVLPEFTLASTTRTASTVVNGRVLAGPPLDLGPMRKVNVTSTHTVTLIPAVGTLPTPSPLTVEPIVGNVPDGLWRVLDDASLGEGGTRTAFTGARVQAAARINDPTTPGSVDQVETGTAHQLPVLLDRDPDEVLSTAMDSADAWAAQQAGADPLDTAKALMGTPAASLARCLGAAVQAATSAGPSPFEQQLLAADRVAPPQLRRITAGLVAEEPSPVEPDVVSPPTPTEPEPPIVRQPVLLARLRPRPATTRRFPGRTTVGEWGAPMPRRHPPDLAAVPHGFHPAASHLFLASPEAVPSTNGTTLAGRDRDHRFSRVGAVLEHRRGLHGSDRAAVRLTASERALRQGATVRAGEALVWHLRRAADDWNPARPTLRVRGSQGVRVVALDRVGGVLDDVTVGNGNITIPIGTSRLTTIATGAASGVPAKGLSGWHTGMTLLRVASDSCIVPGGVLRATSLDTARHRRPVPAALVTGADAIRGARLIETDLPATSRCLVVVLRGQSQASNPASELLLGLDRTEQARDAAGQPVPPLVITSGARIHLLFQLAPRAAGAMTATIGRDQSWRVEGVLASERQPATVAHWLARFGLDEIAAGFADLTELTSTLTWTGAQP
jgi:large repetitive protein